MQKIVSLPEIFRQVEGVCFALITVLSLNVLFALATVWHEWTDSSNWVTVINRFRLAGVSRNHRITDITRLAVFTVLTSISVKEYQVIHILIRIIWHLLFLLRFNDRGKEKDFFLPPSPYHREVPGVCMFFPYNTNWQSASLSNIILFLSILVISFNEMQ